MHVCDVCVYVVCVCVCVCVKALRGTADALFCQPLGMLMGLVQTCKTLACFVEQRGRQGGLRDPVF